MLHTIKILCINVLLVSSLDTAYAEPKSLLQDIRDTLVSISGSPFTQSSLKIIKLQPFTPQELPVVKRNLLFNEFSSSLKKELSIKKQKKLSDVNLGKTTYLAKTEAGQIIGMLLLSVNKPMLTIEKLNLQSNTTEHQIMLASILASTIELARETKQRIIKIMIDKKDKETIQTLIYLDFKRQDNNEINKGKKQQVWTLNLETAKRIIPTKSIIPKPIARPVNK